jgi:cytochrome c peroxidase
MWAQLVNIWRSFFCSVLVITWLIGNGRLGQAAPSGDATLGLPALPTSLNGHQTAKRIALGRRLFLDVRLSRDRSISCSSCHKPEHAFSDGRGVALGTDGRQGTRNTPSLLNVTYNVTEFWDGRRSSLETQALDPLTNPLEHGLRDDAEIMDRIRADPTYMAEFRAAFTIDAVSLKSSQVAQAIVAYERTLIAGGSSFDQFFYGHDRAALDPSEERGLALFRGVAQCSACHTIGQEAALFTDHQFHSVNVGMPRVASKLAAITTRVVAVRSSGARIDATILSEPDIAELGRFVVTLDPADIGKFRTPSLRNVALTAPYMHDGSVVTLDEAVDRELYAHTGEIGRPIILTPTEKADLVAFLSALTSPVAEHGTDGAARPLNPGEETRPVTNMGHELKGLNFEGRREVLRLRRPARRS